MKKLALFLIILFSCGIVYAQRDSAAIRADRINNLLNLGAEKRNKIYWAGKQHDGELSRVPLQFKDSTGRAQAVQRIEAKRDGYFKTVMSPAQYSLYILNKKELLK